MVEVTIPGTPGSFTRPVRMIKAKKAWTANDPKYQTWKAVAQDHMRAARGDLPPYTGPVILSISAYWLCPVSKHRKRQPRLEEWKTSKPDLDNVIKAVMDAGNGVLYLDDAQVVEIVAGKRVAAQGEPAKVEVSLMPA